MSDNESEKESPPPENEALDELGGIASADQPAEVALERLQNDMRVTVQIIPPMGNGEHITKPLILKALRDKKITYGIDEEMVDTIVQERRYMQVITVARGKDPIDGRDASIIFHYQKYIVKQDTSVDGLAKIDYKELGRIINVKADTLLLEKIPPTEGEAGVTTLNKKIRQVKGKDLRIRGGKGVYVDESGLRWFSQIDGCVVFRNDQISVENLIQVEDVNAETGNIRFNGSVVVKGIVEDGFKVIATADIRVMGNVGACTIRSGGDIFISGGVFGKTQAVIESQEGSVSLRFTQDAKVVAAKHIIIDEYSRNSHLRAGKTIHVVNENPNRGQILSGSASAVEEIHCNNVGGEMEIATRVMVGVSKEDLDRIAELEGRIEKRLVNLDNLRKSLFLLTREKRSGGGQLTPHKAELHNKLIATLHIVRREGKKEAGELTDLFRNAHIHKKCHLHVNNQIYPNSEINIQLATMSVGKVVNYATLSNEEGEIRILPYMEHEHAPNQIE